MLYNNTFSSDEWLNLSQFFFFLSYIISDALNFRCSGVLYIYIYIYIQGVTGGMCETSGECSLGQTIPI